MRERRFFKMERYTTPSICFYFFNYFPVFAIFGEILQMCVFFVKNKQTNNEEIILKSRHFFFAELFLKMNFWFVFIMGEIY